MVKRIKKKIASRHSSRRNHLAIPSALVEQRHSLAVNRKAHWNAFKELKTQVDKAWLKYRKDVEKKANPQVIQRDANHLLLLLGECNYMARECSRFERTSRFM